MNNAGAYVAIEGACTSLRRNPRIPGSPGPGILPTEDNRRHDIDIPSAHTIPRIGITCDIQINLRYTCLPIQISIKRSTFERKIFGFQSFSCEILDWWVPKYWLLACGQWERHVALPSTRGGANFKQPPITATSGGTPVEHSWTPPLSPGWR